MATQTTEGYVESGTRLDSIMFTGTGCLLEQFDISSAPVRQDDRHVRITITVEDARQGANQKNITNELLDRLVLAAQRARCCDWTYRESDAGHQYVYTSRLCHGRSSSLLKTRWKEDGPSAEYIALADPPTILALVAELHEHRKRQPSRSVERRIKTQTAAKPQGGNRE